MPDIRHLTDVLVSPISCPQFKFDLKRNIKTLEFAIAELVKS